MNLESVPPSAIIVTGLSGAGRQTALNALEDCGYHRVDNLPSDLIPHLIENNPNSRSLALGLGSRRTDMEYRNLDNMLENLRDQYGVALLFLDADADTIARRYNETRRVHPSASSRDMMQAIEYEKDMLASLRSKANVVIETSRLSPHDLRAEIKRQFNLSDAQEFLITIESFSYKRGTPANADMIFDCRFLKNPHWEADLRPKTGLDADVQNYVMSDKNYEQFTQDIHNMLSYMLPTMLTEGRSYLTLGFGCTGGKHRSVTLTEQFAKRLEEQGFKVIRKHREFENGALNMGNNQ